MQHVGKRNFTVACKNIRRKMMKIHTVQSADTIFKIGRLYSVNPMKIIEANSLADPDRLAVGQKLLIPSVTRTYTVRGGDTLSGISDRFDTDKKSLYKYNPQLCGAEKLYNGQIITVKRDVPEYGMASANGYMHKDCDRDVLSTALPYLTYLTVASGILTDGRIHESFKSERERTMAERMSVTPILRLHVDGTEHDREATAELISKHLKAHGWGGVTLAAYKLQKNRENEFSELCLALKKRLMDDELMLFTECDANAPIPTVGDICDGYMMMYERLAEESIQNAGMSEEKLVTAASNIFEPSKMYIELPTLAFFGDDRITVKDAIRLAVHARGEIDYDDGMGVSWFTHRSYRGSRKDSREVVWENLDSVRAKLQTVGECGLMGICFDIETVPTEYLMMFDGMFRPPYIALRNR